MEYLLQKIEEMGLRVFNSASDGSQIEFSFNVYVKPVDGEANRAIFKVLSKNGLK